MKASAPLAGVTNTAPVPPVSRSCGGGLPKVRAVDDPLVQRAVRAAEWPSAVQLKNNSDSSAPPNADRELAALRRSYALTIACGPIPLWLVTRPIQASHVGTPSYSI